ncbi:hypothetical protein HYP93_gp20 [Stenotrophomonas phage Pokken]|uniref:Uncharacterized protein n=1 Tax=Stenotrophomonas phage Pokken TaxID=2596674 RepID=A0A5B9NEM8_9CAUD|nr:hypothetical protein HYP93_gp20 [Stenotrophomonas phage Pokken]QEG09243.1 hypothetical protein CPT_Pokken_020 [Stenotrophomonas phage Pokken]
MSKKKESPNFPHIVEFTDLNEMMQEVRIHASRHRQIAIDFSETKNAWVVTIMGAFN